MSCQHHCCHETAENPCYRKVLWAAFAVNALMFVVEIAGGLKSGSVSLLSDSLDFLGDSANYLISLFVLGKALRLRATASLVKAYTMGAFGVWVFATTLYRFWYGTLPNGHEMGIIGVLALIANLAVAALLYAFREGDSNMRSVWLCSRNDALGNLAVVAAALAVTFTQSKLPDLGVALLMSLLSLQAAWSIRHQAVQERHAH